MGHYNNGDSDWIESGLSLGAVFLMFALNALLRKLSERVLRIDAERTLLTRRNEQDSHVIIGSDSYFMWLGAPHNLRTRSNLSFATLLSVVIGTMALSIAALSFSGSRTLRTGEDTIKATAREGFLSTSEVLNEDGLEKYADWFRGSGVVSFCQRRSGKTREFYQPYVERAVDTKVYCGKRLNIKLEQEVGENIENLAPSQLKITSLAGVHVSTPFSVYSVHEININGRGYNAVCNSGPYYRGVRSGRVSQSCAFSTGTEFILGGYTVTQNNLSGPGVVPEADNVRYFDSYTAKINTELNEQQLMTAVTLWDIGSMSEVEVAVLSRLSFETSSEPVPSFIGGFERLQIDQILLTFGLGTCGIVFLFCLFILAWDRLNRTSEERIHENVADSSFQSRLYYKEVNGIRGRMNERIYENQLAIRDITECDCDSKSAHSKSCNAEKTYGLVSAHRGRPTGVVPVVVIVAQLNNQMVEDMEFGTSGQPEDLDT